MIELLLFWNLTIGEILEERLEDGATAGVEQAAEVGQASGASGPISRSTEQPQNTAKSEESPAPVATRSKWDQLADCESGNWVNRGASFEAGSARWNWGAPNTIPPWGTNLHHGGLQFHPSTWSTYKSKEHPTYAYEATRDQQITVAERVLASQGWAAWPTCAMKLGWR